eukprot:400079-Prymnesium_polylepis.1
MVDSQSIDKQFGRFQSVSFAGEAACIAKMSRVFLSVFWELGRIGMAGLAVGAMLAAAALQPREASLQQQLQAIVSKHS